MPISKISEITECNQTARCVRSPVMATGGIDHVKKLWLLLQVVETGSLRKAALQAKISAPAVSQAISSLERAVGKKLLLREEKGVKPTSEALSLVEEVAPAIRKLLDLSSLKSTPKIGWISFGTYESLAIDLLPRLVSHFRSKLPETKVTVRVARTATLATMVRKGDLCAALVSESDCLGGLKSVPVGEDRLGFFTSPDFKNVPTTPEKLREAPVGLLSAGADGYPLYFKRFLNATLGEKFKASIVSDSFEALRATALSGEGICLLPSRVAARQPELVEVKVGVSSKNSGLHKLLLVAEPRCDLEEFNFLEKELIHLLAQRPAFSRIQ